MGAKAQYDTMNSLLNLRNEIGLLGVVKLPEFTQTIAIMAEEKQLDEIIRYYFETTENENVLCQPENFKELTYRMWILSKRNQVDMELFQCIYNNSYAILRNPEVKITILCTVLSEGFLYKVAPLELKISPIMYFVIHNSVVLSIIQHIEKCCAIRTKF